MNIYHDPNASQALLPKGYGATEVLLPWRPARERLERALNYWICTASLDARPHAAPLWGAWVDDRLFFEGSPATRWGRDITANPRATLHLESGSEEVIVEGAIEDHDDVGKELAERVADAFAAKYDGYRTQGRGFFILIPRVARGWSQFPRDATRWSFGQEPAE